ncbi:ALF repeat-containing protein [Streptomyces sp. NPDC059096]|uniref:ALF repeat-containing protein n=1 Tax=Streptomyces sp. NPDC059096 TaxID=3346727 RepID=UPI00369B628E
MRPTRAALLVAATALTPALLLTTPAFATGPTVTSVSTTVMATSETPVDEMSEDDLRIAILRILADQDSGKAVVREANKALDNGSPEALRAFLKTGYRLAQAEDDRVAISRILADPTISDALRAAAGNAIDGTPEELRYFIEVGQYEVDG